jgi:predicted NBD/HSP70 family sugar kinase
MDIGGTRTKYSLIDVVSGDTQAFLVEPTETQSVRAFLDAADHALEQLCDQACCDRAGICGCGAGIPGYVDGDLISMIWASLSFMEGVEFRSALEARLRLPVRMDNDARAVALGEAHRGGHGASRRLLSLTLGTGLGFGLVVDGQLQEKSSINHLAGHIPIRPGARPCFCGFSGCLETLVNASALEDHFARLSPPLAKGGRVDARAVFELAANGRPAAQDAVRQLVADLIVGLNAYIHLFGPELIVLGGGLAHPLSPWVAEIQRGLFAKPYDGYASRVAVSELKEFAGLYGAAFLWKED